jgi:NAD(P)H-dependent FMN reductase
MFIPIILGTARIGRQSEKVANYVLAEARKFGLETELIDVCDYRTNATDNTGQLPEAKKLSEKLKKAEGLIIVTPEYNHGYPGELKMMLDLCYKEYFGKPVGFCGVSKSGLGGARCVEQLRQVVVELHMMPIREAVYFSNVITLFDETGMIKDPSYADRLKTFFSELSKYAEALQKTRQ